MSQTEQESAPSLSNTTAPGLTFKKPLKPKNVRKRQTDDSDAPDQDEGSAILQKSKSARPSDKGKLKFTTQSSTKPSGKEDSSSKQGLRTSFAYESTRQIQTETDNGATARLETETEFDRDARAIREKVLKNSEDALKGVQKKADDKVYRGMAGYTDHTAGFKREQTVGGEKASGAHGPLRASAHIRWSVRFDYQPDICKDYKETGYCGYGDACIFLHDRGDYKSGWQLEQEWEESERKRKEKAALGHGGDDEDGKEESEDEDGLPFACFICRQPFTDPVVTRCKHYFCEHCALKHNSRHKTCFVCSQPTNGVFNTAHDIIKRAKEAEKKKAEAGEGEADQEHSDEENKIA